MFRKTHESFGGLSNMAASFSIEVNGTAIRTTEALYQALRFPHLPLVQKLIVEQKSPMTAKMKGKPYRSQSRSDWEVQKISIMRWCLRVKLAFHWQEFGRLLAATQNKAIVEESGKDAFWGAKVINANELEGVNALGRLLMELRNYYLENREEPLKYVRPLTIPNFLFYERPIELITIGSGTNELSANKNNYDQPSKPGETQKKHEQGGIPGFDD